MSCERSFIVFTIYLFYCHNIEVINLIDKKFNALKYSHSKVFLLQSLHVNTTIDTVYNDTDPRGVEKNLLNHQRENFFLKWVIDLSVCPTGFLKFYLNWRVSATDTLTFV